MHTQQIINNNYNQQTTLSSIMYQNSLLKQRNKLLSLQNQNLLQQIDDTLNAFNMSQIKNKQYEKQLAVFQQAKNKEKIYMKKFIEVVEKSLGFGNNQNKNNSNNKAYFNVAKQMIKNQCPIYTILQNLTIAFQIQIENQQNKQNKNAQNTKSDINRLQKLLQKRKQKLNLKQITSKQIIHVVKDPTWQQQKSFTLQQDLLYILKQTQRIIRRIKKPQIDMNSIISVLVQIEGYVYLRKCIREEQKKLAIRERQVQLGVGCRMLLTQVAEGLMGLQKQQLQIKNKIEKQINQL